MSKWQPIETAPKDGTRVLLGGGTYDDDVEREPICSPMVARWYTYKLYEGTLFSMWLVADRECGNACVIYENPTHWMELPEAPK